MIPKGKYESLLPPPHSTIFYSVDIGNHHSKVFRIMRFLIKSQRFKPISTSFMPEVRLKKWLKRKCVRCQQSQAVCFVSGERRDTVKALFRKLIILESYPLDFRITLENVFFRVNLRSGKKKKTATKPSLLKGLHHFYFPAQNKKRPPNPNVGIRQCK